MKAVNEEEEPEGCVTVAGTPMAKIMSRMQTLTLMRFIMETAEWSNRGSIHNELSALADVGL